MEQAANQFAKGLQLDTHPMVQGNDTMSDCLNGTFVTMNGDEVILQNDMGNRKVDNAFLPAGYEPVGIKEYGGIIYLALYNPITNKSQLGSFPSPERIINSTKWDENSVFSQDLQRDFNPESSENKIYYLNNSYKFYSLSDDEFLRAGDKFSLIWGNSDDINKLSNYDNVIDKLEIEGETKDIYKAISPKNKQYTLQIGVLNSQNEFVDITNTLKRWKQNVNDNELCDITDKSSVYIQNVGYFVQKVHDTNWDRNSTKDKKVIEERQAFPVNTYAYKLVGPLYLKLICNVIQEFNYNINVIKTSENDVEFTVIADIVYNCPDGIEASINKGEETEENQYDENYFTYATSKSICKSGSLNINGFNLYHKNNDGNWELITQSSLEYSDDDETNYYDSQTNLYHLRISKTYNLKKSTYFQNDIFNYYIGVDSGLDYESDHNNHDYDLIIKDLSEENSLAWSNIQSGGIDLDYWRYFVYDEHTFDLTYRFSVYPKHGQKFDNLRIKFIPLEKTTSSAANSKIQSEIIDDDNIQQDSQQYDSTITNNNLSTIIRDKTGKEYTLIANEQGNTIAVDNDGTEYNPDELDGYVLNLHIDDSVEEITTDYKVKYDEELTNDPKLYGDYQVYTSNQNITSENNTTSENPSSDGNSSSNKEYIFKLGDGSISNGRVTYSFNDNDITIDGEQFPTDKQVMYKVELLVDDTTTTKEEKVFKCFLLNTTLFNDNYSITSTNYVEDFRNFNNENSDPKKNYHKFLEVKLDLDSKESINVTDPIITSTGSPVNISSNDINYDVCTEQNVQLNSSGILYIHNEGLYPDYMKFNKTYTIQEYSPQGTNKNLYDQVTWHNWPDSESDKPQANDMFEVGTASLSGNYIIKNHDKLKSTGQPRTETLENVFIPVEEAFYNEFIKVHSYSGILVRSEDDGNHRKFRVYLQNSTVDYGGAHLLDGEFIELTDYTIQQTASFKFEQNRISIFDQLNKLANPFAYMLLGITQGDSHYRVTFTNNENECTSKSRSLNAFDGTGGTTGVYQSAGSRRARLWWKCSDDMWVLFPFGKKDQNHGYGLLCYEKFGTAGYLTDYFKNAIYNYMFSNNQGKYYICYYVNKEYEGLYVPGVSKYNEEYSLPLGFGVTWYVNGNLNIEEDDNYYIPKFWINDSSTKEYGTHTVYTDVIINPERTVGHMHINSDSDFFNLIDNYRTMLKNVIIDGNNIYVKDSKKRDLSKNKIYHIYNNNINALTKNPFTLIDNGDTRQILCNSYQISPFNSGYGFRYDIGGDPGNEGTRYILDYNNVPTINKIITTYEP